MSICLYTYFGYKFKKGLINRNKIVYMTIQVDTGKSLGRYADQIIPILHYPFLTHFCLIAICFCSQSYYYIMRYLNQSCVDQNIQLVGSVFMFVWPRIH